MAQESLVKEEESVVDINCLVLSYLSFYCYSETAAEFNMNTKLIKENQTESKHLQSFDSTDDMQIDEKKENVKIELDNNFIINKMLSSLSNRKNLHTLISNGNIQSALEFIHSTYPNLLLNINELSNSDVDKLELTFRLHSLHFIELVRNNNQKDALLYAQSVLAKFGNINTKLLDDLRDIVALMAYQDPQNSPVARFLSQHHRETIADSINSAILLHDGVPSSPPLERLIQHVTVLRETLAEVGSSKDKKLKNNKKWKLDDFLHGADNAVSQ